MYSKRKDRDLSTPFCTFSSGTRYSFMRAGNTVKGEQVSATMAIATVVQTLFWRSCTFRLFRSVANTSWGLGGEKRKQDGLRGDRKEFPPSIHSFSKRFRKNCSGNIWQESFLNYTSCQQNYLPNGFGDITKSVDRSSADGFFVSFQQFQQLKTNPHPLPCGHILSTPEKAHTSRSSSLHMPIHWNDKH